MSYIVRAAQAPDLQALYEMAKSTGGWQSSERALAG